MGSQGVRTGVLKGQAEVLKVRVGIRILREHIGQDWSWRGQGWSELEFWFQGLES